MGSVSDMRHCDTSRQVYKVLCGSQRIHPTITKQRAEPPAYIIHRGFKPSIAHRYVYLFVNSHHEVMSPDDVTVDGESGGDHLRRRSGGWVVEEKNSEMSSRKVSWRETQTQERRTRSATGGFIR